MRVPTTLLLLLVGCGARTPLADETSDAGAALDLPSPVVIGVTDLGVVDLGVDRPTIVDLGVDVPVDRPVVVSTDRGGFCGDGVVGAGEECDRGADNGPTDAFTLSQPGRPSVVVRPLARSTTVGAFYDYQSASAHTGFEDAGLANHILFVDTRTGTLSLVFVAGRDGDLNLTPAQPDASVQVSWSGVPAGAAVALSDEAAEFRAAGGGRFDGRWSFQNNTDGGAIEGLAWDEPWRITAQTLRTDGVTRVRFVGVGGAPVALTLRDDVVLTHRAGDLCREDCRRPRCGDGRLDAGERCDGAGCSSDCQRFD